MPPHEVPLPFERTFTSFLPAGLAPWLSRLLQVKPGVHFVMEPDTAAGSTRLLACNQQIVLCAVRAVEDPGYMKRIGT